MIFLYFSYQPVPMDRFLLCDHEGKRVHYRQKTSEDPFFDMFQKLSTLQIHTNTYSHIIIIIYHILIFLVAKMSSSPPSLKGNHHATPIELHRGPGGPEFRGVEVLPV